MGKFGAIMACFQGSASPSLNFSVGVDIGAAFSGYTYTSLDPKDSVKQVWDYFEEEEELRPQSPKTMSAILYRRHLGRWRAIEWGRRAYNQYQEMPPAHRLDHCLLEDFKIALAGDDERQRFMKRLPQNCGLTVESVVADFLGFVSRHALQKLGGDYKRTVTAEEVVWTLTVPAKWSNMSQLVMREAAVKAGMVTKTNDDRLSIIPEPEAAALSSVHHGELQSNVGESFMVVDGGGATTDITMHEVWADGRLAEAIHATGLAAGSKHIDRAFEDWLRSNVGPNVIQQWKERHPADYLSLMNGSWQAAKCSFGDVSKHQWFIPIAPSLNASIPQQVKTDLALRSILLSNGDSLILHQADMAEFFRCILTDIVKEVTNVVERVGHAPHKILLVGGLGSSKHLLSELQALAGRQGWQSEVLQPLKGYQAVVEGAALVPKEVVQVVRRIATHSYGLLIMPPQDPTATVLSQPSVKKWEPFINIGDVIETCAESQEISIRPMTIRGRLTRVDIPIYQADNDSPAFGTPSQPECVAKMSVDLAVPKGAKPPKSPAAIREVALSYRVGRSKITVVARRWHGILSTCEVPFLYDPDKLSVEEPPVLE